MAAVLDLRCDVVVVPGHALDKAVAAVHEAR
jgi:hypothetical protein